MKNNEILIIIDTDFIDSPYKRIVLKVDRSISYGRLKKGIDFGLGKLDIKAPPSEWKLINTIKTGVKGNADDLSLRELGFVTGTLLSKKEQQTTWFFQSNILQSQLLNKRYNAEDSSSRNVLEYNISNRVITKMEDTVIELLSPGKPPQPARSSLLDTIIPTAISFGTMYGFRMLFLPEASSYMLIYMGGAVLGTFIIQLFRFHNNKANFKASIRAWKSNYENYLGRICNRIEEYLKQDVIFLNDCFPSMQQLIQNIDNISDSLFFRSSNDFDFMMLRLGNSNQVPALFSIDHDVKEEIELGVTFDDDGRNIIIDLCEEQKSIDINNNGESNSLFAAVKKQLSTVAIRIATLFNRNSDLDEKHYLGHGYLNELSEYLATIKYPFLESVSIDLKDNENKNKENVLYPPLVIDFKNCGAMGCINFNELEQQNLFDHIILELAAYHSPHDLQFVIFFNPESDINAQEERISHYRCLPHFNELFDNLAQFVFDDKSAGLVFSNLETIMSKRMIELKSKDEDDTVSYNFCQIVCIFEYDYKLKEKAFSKHLPISPKKGESYNNRNGLTFVFSVNYKEMLPQYCGIMIERKSELRTTKRGTLVNTYGTIRYRNQTKLRNRKIETQRFEDSYVFGKDKQIEYTGAFARLSSLYCLHIQENGAVPDKVSLFDLYADLKDINKYSTLKEKIKKLKEFIESQWDNNKNNITNELAVPIGKGENGNVVLDLHENADGPHMLVAGTTGSGKSETMLTYLIGLCIRFSPQYLNLILVDMKGNSFAGRLKDLPHCVATVDNVSSEKGGVSPIYMLKRFLEILKAEIKRREIIFEKYGVDKLDNYIEVEQKISDLLKNDNNDKLDGLSLKQKAILEDMRSHSHNNKGTNRPPVLAHLVFVVDEFTELKRFGSETDTDYIGELTSIARIGRTLGLHMILVSQNIENAITDDIRVNTRARICLKVATRGASKEMLDGRSDAYYSYMPQGRAFFLVGSGTTYEYFQSAYASENLETISEPRCKIVQMEPCGEHNMAFYDSYNDDPELNVKDKMQNKDNTQLNAVIKAISQLATRTNSFFQPPLDSEIKYSDYLSSNAN